LLKNQFQNKNLNDAVNAEDNNFEYKDFNVEAQKYFQINGCLLQCQYNKCKINVNCRKNLWIHWQTNNHLKLWNSFKRETLPDQIKNQKVDFEVNIANNKFEITCKHCEKYVGTPSNLFNNECQKSMDEHWISIGHKCNDTDKLEYFLYVVRNEYRYYCIQCKVFFSDKIISEHFKTIHDTILKISKV
jgi:hypothetical protein